MDGNEDYIVVFIHKFYHLVHPSFVVFHPHKSAENSDAVIDVDDVISDAESTEIIQCELLTFLYTSAYADTVKTVENFVVGIATNLVVIVDKTAMNILPGNELRHHASVLVKYGFQPLRLSVFFTINLNPETMLHPAADVLRKKLEIFIENRLWSDAEFYRFHPLFGQRNFQENSAEFFE